MGNISDLKLANQAKLRKFVGFWSLVSDNEQIFNSNFPTRDLNKPISVLNASFYGLNGPLAGYFLHYAVQLGDEDLVQDLCEKGADVNKTDDVYTHKSPLQLATDYGRPSIVRILLEYEAKREGISIDYSLNPCTQPLTFLWGMKEFACGRSVNYGEVRELVEQNVSINVKLN